MTEIYEEPSSIQEASIDLHSATNDDETTSSEGLLALVMVMLGIAGVYLVGSTYEQPSVYNTNISPSRTYNEASSMVTKLAPSRKTPESDKVFENQLKVSGVHEITQQLAFSIENFDSSVDYVIDLGNGDLIIPSQEVTYYQYQVSGSYLVELIATYKGQESILYSDFVDIHGPKKYLSNY